MNANSLIYHNGKALTHVYSNGQVREANDITITSRLMFRQLGIFHGVSDRPIDPYKRLHS